MEPRPSQIPPLLPGLFLLLIITGCSIAIGWGSSWRVHGLGSMTYTSNGEAVRANIVGDEVQIAVLRDGQLLGVDGMSASQRKNLRGLTSGGRKFVDHPQLEAWRDQLANTNDLAQKPGTTARELADAAKGLPFRGLIDDAVMKWVDDDPARACAMLNVVGELKPGKQTGRKVLAVALKSDEVDDERIAAWLETKTIGEDKEALKTLAGFAALGPNGAEQILLCVDDVYGSDRKDVYMAAGKRLVGDPAHARLLVSMLDDLYGSNRSEAALALLRHPDSSVEYAIQLLENIDEFYGSNRLQVYLSAGQKAIVDARAPRLLTTQIDELYGSDRKKAALAALDWEGADQKLALGLLREIDEFYGSSQVTVIHRIIDGRHFQDARVQRGCLRAIEDELYGNAKRKALTRMLKSEELDAQVRRLVIRALDD
ncbi:MAG: hypothetical protein ACYTGW_12780 [Planctomycetota bacterium]|jgi:hypothetical protein